jgi:hypothetical protein
MLSHEEKVRILNLCAALKCRVYQDISGGDRYILQNGIGEVYSKPISLAAISKILGTEAKRMKHETRCPIATDSITLPGKGRVSGP